jgi:diaminohydroxyphosphoribosylaminopyrimidine deaminase/5-amino-6-(5-phosphoribosylamino)uracil reductase
VSVAGVTVTLKLATSLDGRIALGDGRSKWITGPQAREQVHLMRARHDAVLTGVGTVLADNPQMTARPGGVAADVQPVRAVMDTHLRTPASAALFGAGPVVIYHSHDDGPAMIALAGAGAQLQRIAGRLDGRACLGAALEHLAGSGVRTVMIEAGGTLAGAALRSGRVDRIEWFRAPKLIGAEGRPCIAELGLESLDAAPIFTRTQVRSVGADLWETYERS